MDEFHVKLAEDGRKHREYMTTHATAKGTTTSATAGVSGTAKVSGFYFFNNCATTTQHQNSL